MSWEVLHHTHDDVAQPLAQVSLEAKLPLAWAVVEHERLHDEQRVLVRKRIRNRFFLSAEAARAGDVAAALAPGRAENELVPNGSPHHQAVQRVLHCARVGLGAPKLSGRAARNETLHTPVMMKHHPPQERHVVGEAFLRYCRHCSLTRLHTTLTR